MTDTTASSDTEFRYHAGFEYPAWDFQVTAETQARKLACCDIDPALYGDRVDITHYALATVLSAKRAGLPVNGRVHMTQRFIQNEQIVLGETLTVRGEDIKVVPARARRHTCGKGAADRGNIKARRRPHRRHDQDRRKTTRAGKGRGL
jgi:hypothetical protein